MTEQHAIGITYSPDLEDGEIAYLDANDRIILVTEREGLQAGDRPDNTETIVLSKHDYDEFMGWASDHGVRPAWMN